MAEATKEQRARWKNKVRERKRRERLHQEAKQLDEANMPEVMKDFRHVYNTVDGSKDTPGQEVARALLLRDAKGFVAQMVRMETDWRQMKMAVGVEAVVSDKRLDECLKLAETLLEELVKKGGG